MRFFPNITTLLATAVAYLAAVANALQFETIFEAVQRGYSYEIRWSPADIPVKIELLRTSRGGDGLVSVLANSATDGVFIWRINPNFRVDDDYALQLVSVETGETVKSDVFAVTNDAVTTAAVPIPVTSFSTEASGTVTGTGTATATTATAETSDSAVTRPDGASSGSSPATSLPLGGIIGLSVGCTLAGVLLAVLAFWLWRRRRRNQKRALSSAQEQEGARSGERGDGAGQPSWEKQELDGDGTRVYHELESPGAVQKIFTEKKAGRAELETRERRGELAGVGRLEVDGKGRRKSY